MGKACSSTSTSAENELASPRKRESEKMESTALKSSSEGSKQKPTRKTSSGFLPLKFLAGRSGVTTEALQKWACSRALLNGALPEGGLHLEKWSALEGTSGVHWWNVRQQTAEDVKILRQNNEKFEHRLFEVGFSKKEVELLLQVFPEWLEADLSCVHSVYRALQSNRMSEQWIHDLLKNSFSVFLQCRSKVCSHSFCYSLRVGAGSLPLSFLPLPSPPQRRIIVLTLLLLCLLRLKKGF